MNAANFVFIIGSVVAEPDLRTTADGQRRYINFQVGIDHHGPALYVNVRQFVTATTGMPNLKAGDRVQIVGELRSAGSLFFISVHTIAVIVERRPESDAANFWQSPATLAAGASDEELWRSASRGVKR